MSILARGFTEIISAPDHTHDNWLVLNYLEMILFCVILIGRCRLQVETGIPSFNLTHCISYSTIIFWAKIN
jgi:hypothetical protein